MLSIHLIAVGTKMPEWVEQGYQEYAKRLAQDCRLLMKEIPAGKRGKNADINRIRQQEGELMLESVPADSRVIALDVTGKKWSTEELAEQIQKWLNGGSAISLLIGGPEGLAKSCLDRAAIKWSLSPLTFPHPLVRIMVAEQIYRAWSLLKKHPYHRG